MYRFLSNVYRYRLYCSNYCIIFVILFIYLFIKRAFYLFHTLVSFDELTQYICSKLYCVQHWRLQETWFLCWQFWDEGLSFSPDILTFWCVYSNHKCVIMNCPGCKWQESRSPQISLCSRQYTLCLPVPNDRFWRISNFATIFLPLALKFSCLCLLVEGLSLLPLNLEIR